MNHGLVQSGLLQQAQVLQLRIVRYGKLALSNLVLRRPTKCYAGGRDFVFWDLVTAASDEPTSIHAFEPLAPPRDSKAKLTKARAESNRGKSKGACVEAEQV